MATTKEQIERIDQLSRKLAAVAKGHANGDVVAAAVNLIASLIATADNREAEDDLAARACLAILAAVDANQRDEHRPTTVRRH